MDQSLAARSGADPVSGITDLSSQLRGSRGAGGTPDGRVRGAATLLMLPIAQLGELDHPRVDHAKLNATVLGVGLFGVSRFEEL